MKDKETLSSAAKAAIQQGEERLSAYESPHKMQLPPPYPAVGKGRPRCQSDHEILNPGVG
jgi:hypothetical protein